MTACNLYAAGKRGPAREGLLGQFPTFAAALEAWEASQGGERPAWAIVPVGEAGELDSLGALDSIVPGYDLGRYGRGVYVTRCGDGVSTLGFGYAETQRAKVAAWLEAEGKPLERVEAAPGTLEAFAAYQAAMTAGRAHNAATGRKCHADLTPELSGLEGKRVEVVDCHGETRRFWVGRSSGWLPIHLEIERRNSSGGCGVMGTPFRSVREVR